VFSLFAVLPVLSAGNTAREDTHAPQPPLQAPPPEQESPVKPEALVFTGVAGRLSNRDASVQAALRDAARRLSFFYSVTGRASKREHIGAASLDYRIESEYQLTYDEDLDKFLDLLEFDPAQDIFENNNAVFVVTRGPSGLSMPLSRGHSFKGERPAWIDAPPSEIDGFIAGVGFSSRLASHKDTVIASYENTVLEIIDNINSAVRGEQTSYQNSYSAFGTEMTNDNSAVSEGTLRHFYVIESWTDPVNLAVWTLAVASRPE
jgi:hypothetical protein